MGQRVTVYCYSEGEWGTWSVPAVCTDDPKELIAAYDALICVQCGAGTAPCEKIKVWETDLGLIGYGYTDHGPEVVFAANEDTKKKVEEIFADQDEDEEMLPVLERNL